MQPPDDAHLAQQPEPVKPLPPAAAAMTSASSSSLPSPRLPQTRQSLPPTAHHPLAQADDESDPTGSGGPAPSARGPRRAQQQPPAPLPLRDRRSTASLFRSTLTPPGSRSASPAGSFASARSPGRASTMSLPMTGSVFGGGGRSPYQQQQQQNQSLLDAGAADNPGDPLSLMLHSFVPHIAIHASADVDGLARGKGFAAGLWELLRPFGERVQGKVMVRDSNGASRPWEDFSVRFVRYGEGLEEPDVTGLVGGGFLNGQGGGGGAADTNAGSVPGATSGSKRGDIISQVEAVVDRHLKFAEEAYVGSGMSPSGSPTRLGLDMDATSPYYALYLRRLLSGLPFAPHESFAHPVACVMAISSRDPAPIETLQKLYRETSQGDRSLPPWVDGEYLRYYVLVHDEEDGDITKSMALFDQMKRNFGLHCHLLRLRSTQSAETDDDSIPLPRSDWMTASEELADIEASETREDFEDPTRYIFESDATAIRTLVREMVTQSVVPTMERNVSVWNDQVASRRRGLSGRFMSLSKRWTFGSSSRSSSGAGGSGGGGGGSSSGSNYDSQGGFYRADSSEAIMRRLADYAFMLRDWKLAMSTYELLRSDFQNDKAWKYHASANEMAALALLIMPPNMSSKTRIETINQMLEQALYSYHTRCDSLYGAVRCTVLALELLRLRGGSGVDEAVRWGIRVLEARLTGPVGDALLRERMAVCYASKSGHGSQAWGARRRKSALWSVLGAEAWVALGKHVQAQRCLGEARRMYALLPAECGVQNFGVASDFLAGLQGQVKAGLRADGAAAPVYGDEAGENQYNNYGGDGNQSDDEQSKEEVDEERETLGTSKQSKRMSLINPAGVAGVGGGGSAGLETAPLHDTLPAQPEEEAGRVNDGFG